MRHKHERRNTEEYIQELQQLDQGSLSPAHQILGLSKNEEEETPEEPKKQRKEVDKVKDALTNLKEDKPNVKGMFSRIYSIPSNARSKISQMTGQVPRSANVYGSHYPVARILNDNNTLVLHTSDYGTDGKTKELIEKIKNEVPSIFPDFKVVELHHPDYRHSAKAMRIKSEKNLADYFKAASENHPDEEYRKHALDAHLHLTKIKKAEYSKPIHQKRIENEGWDGKQNEQKRVGRISDYLQRVGLTPDLDSDEGRTMGATFPSSVSINPEGDPHDQQLIHEAGHAMLTPVGQSLPEYQAFIGKPGLEGKLKATAYRKEMQDIHGGGLPEQTAQHMEAGIARRSGVEPFRSPKRGVNPNSAEEKSRRHAQKTLGLLDEGIHTFDPFTGEKQYGETVDALINARARKDKSLIKPIQEKVHSRLKQGKDFDAEEFLAASEKDFFGVGSSLKKAAIDLVKGSLQRKMPFNPLSSKNRGITNHQRQWTHDEQQLSRDTMDRMDENPKKRALRKLASQTHIRKHPETGERMYLMHRGMGKEEFHGANKDGKTTHAAGERTSWTPDRASAETFGGTLRSVAAWIPESALIHSVNQFNTPSKLNVLARGRGEKRGNDRSVTEREEKEWIVEHGSEGFYHANLDALMPHKSDAKINQKQGKSGDKASYKAASLKQIKPRDIHQGQYGWQGDEKKLAANEKQKPDLKKTLTAGIPVGAPSSLTGGEALQKESLNSELEQVSQPSPKKIKKSKNPFNKHPRGYYQDKAKEEKRKKQQEIERKKTGAKKPLDAALDKLKLEKGERGDWNKEGYKIKQYRTNQDGESYFEMLHPHLKNDLGKPLAIAHASFDDRNNAIDVWVHPEHRRKGISSGLYSHAESKIGKVKSGKTQSPDGKAFWNQPDRKFGKSELYEDWFFVDDFGLEKAEIPEKEGVRHPEFQSWETKRHPNGKMMYHHTPDRAKAIDRVTFDKKSHQKIMNQLPDTHKQAYANMVKQVVTDPNRHFIPTEENGQQKIRARHLNELLSGSNSVKLDTSDPDHLTFHRQSHSKGMNIGKTISIKIPTKGKI